MRVGPIGRDLVPFYKRVGFVPILGRAEEKGFDDSMAGKLLKWDARRERVELPTFWFVGRQPTLLPH